MDDERPPEPSVERVERHDGRYILYFSWPAGSSPADSSPAEQPAEDASAADE